MLATWAVEVQAIAPLVRIVLGEVRGRVSAEDTAIRPEVVVDDIEDDAQAGRMRPIDEARKSSGVPYRCVGA